MTERERLTLVGAGPVGSLLSIFLARRGYDVEILERRPDMRRENVGGGRSINLAVSVRGWDALARVGLEPELRPLAIPMRGRLMHSLDGALTFQPYGRSAEDCIYSMSRGGLNALLMTHAERTGKVRIRFGHRCTGLNDPALGSGAVIATDGSGSAIRQSMKTAVPGFQLTEDLLDYGYKELTMPAVSDGGFAMEKHALHIWPRGRFMLIALPNLDGSFTCTLFLQAEGAGESFETLKTPESVTKFFQAQFPDVLPLMPDLVTQFFENPVGRMVTVRCSPWNVGGRSLLVGDAAHAIVPFFGQGMNCGFEDCVVLDALMESRGGDWETVFSEFSRDRKSDADAIAALALENFVEMRDRVADPQFLLRKAVEKILEEKFPGRFVSRYSMVTFSRAPYREALRQGKLQEEMFAQLCKGLARPEDVDLGLAERLIGTGLK